MKAVKIFIYIFLSLLAIGIILASYLYYVTYNSKSGTKNLVGLQGQVIVQWDNYGIPHINALSSDQDAFFALGYLHAQDRLWQMEFQRHVVKGSLSEIFGKATLSQDKFLRTWGFYRAAEAAWPALDDNTKAIVHSYTAGVNAFLAHGKLPLEFKILRYKPGLWTDIDSIAWQKMMAYDLQNIWQQKITNYLITKQLGGKQLAILKPAYPVTAPTILTEADLKRSHLLSPVITKPSSQLTEKSGLAAELAAIQQTAESIQTSLGFADMTGKGSNNWVIAGRYTRTGKPLLANDPHLSLNAPSLWYLAELKGPTLHVTGATLPGIPTVAIGHNDDIAWGVTNVNPDTQDLYVELQDAPLKILHETIKVRGEASVDLPVYISQHGPIISPISDASKINQFVALKWTGLMAGDTTVASFIKINYAKNWQDFTDALKEFIVPAQNFVYADTKGNIGYYMAGKIPLRKNSDTGLPFLANDHEHEWSSFIPFAKLPHVLNPAEGYIATANNAIVPNTYPYEITFRWSEPPYRIKRILSLLKAAQYPVDVAYMQKMQADTFSELWLDLRPQLLKTKPLDNASEKALAILQQWDGKSDLKNVGATVFAYWYDELLQMPKLSFAKQWREPLFIKQQLTDNGEYCRDPQTKTCADYQSKTLQQAMQKLVTRLGANTRNWKWQNVHTAVFNELGLGKINAIGWMWRRSIATPGSVYTVNVGTYRAASSLEQDLGPSYRQIVDLGQLDNSLYILTLGQSGNLFARHYADQMRLWRNGQYLPMQNEDLQEQMVLQPG